MPPSVTMVPGSAYIKISNLFVREDDEINAILLHEMIHAYFATVGAADEQHGPRFMAMLSNISKKSGLKLPKTEKLSAPVLAEKTEQLEIAVILVDSGERLSYAITAPARLKSGLDDLIDQWNSRVDVGIVNEVSVWTIKSDLWTAKAMEVPVQRKALTRLSLFLFRDGKEMVDDLRAHGKKVAQTTPRNT